jgi:hypothetical protein
MIGYLTYILFPPGEFITLLHSISTFDAAAYPNSDQSLKFSNVGSEFSIDFQIATDTDADEIVNQKYTTRSAFSVCSPLTLLVLLDPCRVYVSIHGAQDRLHRTRRCITVDTDSPSRKPSLFLYKFNIRSGCSVLRGRERMLRVLS